MADVTDPEGAATERRSRARVPRASKADDYRLAFDFAPLPLPPPALPYVELQFALEVRRSTRELLAEELDLGVIGGLLWAAAGVNRRDTAGRTTPSAQGWHEVQVYLVSAQGAWRYDAIGHRLMPVAAGDLRAYTGEQAFVAEAPLDLVYVADFDRMAGAMPQDRPLLAGVTAGAMAQSAHLAAAAFELGCVLRASIDRPHLAACLNLGTMERVLLAQTFGWPVDPSAV